MELKDSDLLAWIQIGCNSLTLQVPSRILARNILYYQSHTLAQWAASFGFDAISINFPEADRPFRIPVSVIANIKNKDDSSMSSIISAPGLYLGEIKIYTPEFLRTIANLFERKNDRFAVVRVSDNLQIAVTAGMSGHLGSIDLQPNTRVKREEYWFAEDLYEFNRTWRRDLSEDIPIEFTYRALTNSVVSKEHWSKFTTKYRLIGDGSEHYHMAEILAIEPITAPTKINF